MIVKVGLLTSAASTPSPSARPRVNAVLPAPRSPYSSTTAPGLSVAARSIAASSVSASELVVTVIDQGGTSFLDHFAAGGQFHHRVADVSGKIASGHRHFPFVCFRQVAGHAVKINREFAGGLGIEQLRQPCGDHAGEHIAGAA